MLDNTQGSPALAVERHRFSMGTTKDAVHHYPSGGKVVECRACSINKHRSNCDAKKWPCVNQKPVTMSCQI